MTASTDAFHFLLLTDLHLPPPGELLQGRDTAARLEAVLDDIAARQAEGGGMPAPAFAVLTGDLTRDGEPAAYARLKAVLAAKLPCPAHFLLGNHDDRAAFHAAFPEAPTSPGGFVQQALPTPAGLCVTLDTLRQGHPEGELCPARLAWLAETLAAGGGAEEGPVMVFMHHPPVPVGIAGMDAIGLRDAAALWEVLAPHRCRIRQIVHGHLHRPIAGSWHGIPVFGMRGSAFDVALDLAQGPGMISVESHLPPCYGVVRVQGDAVVIHPRDLTPTPPPPPAA